jgi:hypothetical protein
MINLHQQVEKLEKIVDSLIAEEEKDIANIKKISSILKDMTEENRLQNDLILYLFKYLKLDIGDSK